MTAHAVGGMSGKSIELDHRLTYAGRAGQPGGKGWVRLSPRGVQEGQEVDPAQPPVPNPQRGYERACLAEVRGDRLPHCDTRIAQHGLNSSSPIGAAPAHLTGQC